MLNYYYVLIFELLLRISRSFCLYLRSNSSSLSCSFILKSLVELSAAITCFRGSITISVAELILGWFFGVDSVKLFSFEFNSKEGSASEISERGIFDSVLGSTFEIDSFDL